MIKEKKFRSFKLHYVVLGCGCDKVVNTIEILAKNRSEARIELAAILRGMYDGMYEDFEILD